MSTVTYLPLAKNSFILSSNREEKSDRFPALEPEIYHVDGKKLIYPKDTNGGGTWIGASDSGTVACLLNGGVVPHKSIPPYKHSRGLVLLDVLNHSTIFNFYFNYSFIGIEPLTLIVFQDEKLYELIWDGKKVSFKACLETESQIWSSVILYTPECIARRKESFKSWSAQQTEFSPEVMREFYKTLGTGLTPSDLLSTVEKKELTISLTYIEYSPQGTRMIYEDMVGNNFSEAYLTHPQNIKASVK